MTIVFCVVLTTCFQMDQPSLPLGFLVDLWGNKNALVPLKEWEWDLTLKQMGYYKAYAMVTSRKLFYCLG